MSVHDEIHATSEAIDIVLTGWGLGDLLRDCYRDALKVIRCAHARIAGAEHELAYYSEPTGPWSVNAAGDLVYSGPFYGGLRA